MRVHEEAQRLSLTDPLTGEEISAVLWSSDLRSFTARSDRLPGDRMIALLNALFDAQAVTTLTRAAASE